METNPLPHVSSAKAWSTLVRKAPVLTGIPVIREKKRADSTEEICADDIMVIVPATAARAPSPSSEELDDSDLEIEVEHAPVVEEFRPPKVSVHATQEILADDVLEVANAPIPEERPSSIPPAWTVDAHTSAMDEFEFPTPPQYSGAHAAISTRITAFSATQVFRRRSTNVKVVIASMSLAATVVLIAGIARLAPTSSTGFASEAPIGISIHTPKKLDKTIRARTLAYGKATQSAAETNVAAVSIDSLPSTPRARRRR